MYKYSFFPPIILVDLNKPWEKVLSLGTPQTFQAKHILSLGAGGGTDSGLYYIRRGRIRLSNIAANGQEKVLFYMGNGTIFNEIPMLQMAGEYVFTSMETTEAVFWPKKRISVDFVREYPELLLNLLDSMSKKSQSFYTQLCNLRSFAALGNVCRALYSMHLHNRVGSVIVPRLTQQELAAYLGMHRSSLHKALTRLENEGIIENYSKKKLIICDVERLRWYAEELRYG